MTVLEWVALALCVGLFVYLLAALLRPSSSTEVAMGWLQIAVYVVLLVLLAKPLGEYMARVYAGERTFLTPVLGGLERMLLRLLGVRPDDEAHWKRYGAGLLAFNALGFLAVYALQARAARAAAEPRRTGSGLAALLVQHRRQLRHEHELAGLRRARPRSRTSCRCWA
jgi:K+-transporting ATPase KdpF subunit